MVETPQFNVLEHNLVPEHRLLSDEEAEAVLAKLKISKDQLPKIRKNDACIKVLEKISHTDIKEGSIIQITRKSKTAEVAVAYRLVRG
ncbi:MAG: DNA-directed RNA polymerase subunit H [Methanomassiliicoccales archaeon]|nr:MAG: DNA-directed RNA polymerase subunit H [Methanomassiliicoccales archaeon]